MIRSTIRDVALKSEIVFPRHLLSIPNCLVCTNIGSVNPLFGTYLRDNVYQERTCLVDSVDICSLPPRTTIFGGGMFVTAIDGTVVQEQLHPRYQNDDVSVSAVIEERRGSLPVDGEHVLLARFGVGTWGHWVGELLPKAVIAETYYPNRFKYVVPAAVLKNPAAIWRRIQESLAAYGIAIDRLLGLVNHDNYEFLQLFALTPIRSNYTFHPAALDLLSRKMISSRRAPNRKVALLRTDAKSRNIGNMLEVASVLEARGFEFLTTADMSFKDQVQLFQEAGTVVGVLGSGLSGLVYSPYAVKVASLAPPKFGDRFFYSMIQQRNGIYADLRGEISEIPSALPDKDYQFEVKVSDLILGLEALGQ